MMLQYANGIAGGENLDFINYHYTDEIQVQGKEKNKEKIQANTETSANFDEFMQHVDSIPDYGLKKKKGFKVVLNHVNKFNPFTIKLRNGILASMKLNTNNIAGNLRLSYITPDDAKQRGLDMGVWERLVEIRQKFDSLYYTAGGKPENLKTTILSGKGNADNSIQGCGYNRTINNYISEQTPLNVILGSELFHNENEHEQVIAASLKTDSVLASAKEFTDIATRMIQKAGDVYTGKEFSNTNAKDNLPKNAFASFFNDVFKIPARGNTINDTVQDRDNEMRPDEFGKVLPETALGSATATDANPPVIKSKVISISKSFLNQHKKSIIAGAIGLIGMIVIGIWMYGHYAKQNNTETLTHKPKGEVAQSVKEDE